MVHLTLPRKRLRSVHEALFVLEKNAKNIGTSNKSQHGIQEHKEAMELISSLSLSAKERKELAGSTILESLVKLLDPCESSALQMMSDTDKIAFKVSTLNLLKELIDSPDNSLKVSTLGIGPVLMKIWKQHDDFAFLEASKSFLVKLYEVAPLDRVEVGSNDELLICTLKLVRKLNSMDLPKALICNSELVQIMFKLYQDPKRQSFILKKGKIDVYREAMIVHLLKSLGGAVSRDIMKPHDMLSQLSTEKENCELIVAKDGIDKICARLKSSSTKLREKGVLVEILKHILNSDDSETGLALYEEILAKGGVKNLDCFLLKKKSNKKFTVRMINQQKIQRNQMKTKARMRTGLFTKTYKISDSDKNLKNVAAKKPPKEISGDMEV